MKKGSDVTENEEFRGRVDNSRDNERTTRASTTRDRDAFYFLPDDIDHLDVSTVQQLHLVAPPPRIDPHWGKMVQRWVDVQQNNQARMYDMMRIHWRPRDPNTVPNGFRGRTGKWSSKDVIMVANHMVLMELPESIHKERTKQKLIKNKQRIDDIRDAHGRIMRDGEIIDYKDPRRGRFAEEQVVSRSSDDSSREISFAD